MLLSALFIFSIQGHTSEKTRGQWASAANFIRSEIQLSLACPPEKVKFAYILFSP